MEMQIFQFIFLGLSTLNSYTTTGHEEAVQTLMHILTLEKTGVHDSIIIKWILRNRMGRRGLD